MTLGPGRIAVAALALLAGRPARAQVVTLGVERELRGVVLGRACLDEDGDGHCSEGEPGVAGARILGSWGGVAVADGEGRFHLLDVPERVLGRDRLAYGAAEVALEGLGVRRALEVPPAGAVAVDLPVPAPAPAQAPALAPEPARSGPGRAGAGPGGPLPWIVAARVEPGSRVRVGGAAAPVDATGVVEADVALAPGSNALALTVEGPSGATALVAWSIHRAVRRAGGDLVLPSPPERLATFRAVPGAGGGALVAGAVAPGARLRVGGLAVSPGPAGAFAAWLRAGAGGLEVVGPEGARAGIEVEVAAPRGIAAAAGTAEVEVALSASRAALWTARGTGAVRARLGGAEVEAGVDVDDRDRPRDLLRPRDGLVLEQALDPARTFLTAGDGAAAGDRNPGGGRAWARIEADGARLVLGPARAGLTGSELGRYDRAFSGAKAVLDRRVGPVGLAAAAFGAALRADAAGNPAPVAAHDALRATGGVVHWLAHGEVVPGSEGLRVEWRDPFTGLAVAHRTLVRGDDYEVEWTTGRVTLAVPLPTVEPPAAVATGEPLAAAEAVLVADYLHAAGASPDGALAGGRVGAAAGPIALSVHAAREEGGAGAPDWSLLGGAARLEAGPLELRVEAARSRGLLFGPGAFARSPDGGLTSGAAALPDGDADALHLEARGEAGPVRARAWWRRREAGFSDGAFLEAIAAREGGAEVSAEAGAIGATLLWAERAGADPADPAGAAPLEARRAVARAGWRAEAATLTAEAVSERLVAPASGEALSAGLRGTLRLRPGLALDLSHHHGLRSSGAALDRTFSAAGVVLGAGRATLSARGGWGPALGPRLLVAGERRAPGEAVYGTFAADAAGALGERGGALGARRTAGGVELFTEEQLARDAFGLRAGRVMGLSVAPAEGLVLTLSAERGERLRPDGTAADRSAAAAALRVARGRLRASLRGEARDEGGFGAAAAGAAAEWLATRRLTLGLRTSWARGTAPGRDALAFEAAAGGAWRSDRLSVAVTAARLAERRPGETRRDGVVGRLAASASAGRLTAGFGGGVSAWRAAGGRDERVAGSVRAAVRVVGPLDLAAEYARRAPLRGRLGALDATRVEAGLAVARSRLAVGYTLVGFGGDGLDPAEETHRLFVRAQLAL